MSTAKVSPDCTVASKVSKSVMARTLSLTAAEKVSKISGVSPTTAGMASLIATDETSKILIMRRCRFRRERRCLRWIPQLSVC